MMKWLAKNWLLILGIYISYTSAWYLGWQLSVNLTTAVSITSWFLPTGIRVASLLLVDKKYWPVIAFAEITAIYAVNSAASPYTTFIGEAVGTFIPILMYMIVVHHYLKHSKQVKFDSVQHVIKLFTWCSIGALLTASILVSSIMLQEKLTEDSLIATTLLFMLGDFVGIMLIVPITFALKSLHIKNKISAIPKHSSTWIGFAIIVFYLICSIIFTQQNMVYYVKAFAFIPIIIIAYRNGWIGAVFSIFVVNIDIILASIVTTDFGNRLENQIYLIAISMTGILLGAAMSEQKLLNLILAKTNNQLLESLLKNQKLAQKVVNIQEDERKTISMALHDELGQNMAALKLNLQVVNKMLGESKVTPILKEIENITNITYQSAHTLMHWLRPRVLDDMGLEVALKEDTFTKLLKNADIHYSIIINGDLTLLSDDLAIAIYRISQESITNTAKYSKANNCRLSLSVDSSKVELEVKDDGEGFAQKDMKELNSSFGIQGIKDRILALGGNYTLTSNSNGTSHKATFNI